MLFTQSKSDLKWLRYNQTIIASHGNFGEALVEAGDSSTGMQALPVGKIIEAKVLRKDNQEIVQTCIMCE